MFVRAGAVLLVASCMALGGCVSDPVIALSNARVVSSDDKGVTLTITMNVKNDNSFDVLVHDLHAEILLEDLHVLPPIDVSPNMWLAAGSTTPVELPVVVPWPIAWSVLEGKDPMVHYRARGRANVTGSRTLKVDKVYKIDQEGYLQRSELMGNGGGAAPVVNTASPPPQPPPPPPAAPRYR